jgi:hypothetical protein
MSILIDSPVLSLTPIIETTVVDPIVSLTPIVERTVLSPFVDLVPVATRIKLEPGSIFYDPYRTYDLVYPNSAYYFSYPDLNTDINIQKKILNSVWNKLEDKWVLSYLKIYNYIKKSGSTYKLVDSLEDGAGKTSTVDIEDKADWLLTNYYKKSDLAATIEKFRSRLNINWWDVNTSKYIYDLKNFIYNQIRRKIMNELA